MNERIKELKKLATTTRYTGHGEIDELDKEKFAELIIKECLEQVRDEVQYEHDWKLADAVSNRVLKHFGVEE